jgi:hypothetical protein
LCICHKESFYSDVDYDTFGGGYTNEADAIKRIWEITDSIYNQCLGDVDEEHCYRGTNDSGSWQMVRVNERTYEYWTKAITVEV